ncbi:MAG: nucleotidyltransferase domain-containing protein [Hyphomicrobiaceae bacterium]
MMTTEERAALEAFVAGVRAHYGARLVDIFVFGSRARGDATPDSDVDLAIILQDGDWTLWSEKRQLLDFVHEALVHHGLYIQAWPLRQSAWHDPSLHPNPRFIRSIRHDAKPVVEAV